MSGLRTFVVGLPPANVAARCCSMSVASSISAPPFSFCQRTSKTFLPRAAAAAVSSPTSFIRTKTDLASSAQKSIDAGTYKTASDLAAKRPSVNNPPHSQPPSNPAGQPPPLDWNTFFKLRMRRRRIQVFFSIISGAGGLFAGAGVLSTGLAEPLVSQVPLDPIFTLGGLTLVFAAAGWLVGPSIGGQVFSMLNRGLMPQIRSKEGEFLTRIKKNRVDPSNSSAANPVPDFYGEKIQSVQGYRQWLKDQRAFNRKKTANFV